MKQALILLMVSLIFGCKTTKLDVSNGDKNPTWNTRHMRKIHEKQGGFWAAGKWIKFPNVTYKSISND